jgi:protein-S-isoprenylcysteine O-methyltransferase Ste14
MSFYTNIWVYYFSAYIFFYLFRRWAENKRGEPFEDPELASQKIAYIPATIWIFAGFIIGLFIPVSINLFFISGTICTLIGVGIVGLAFYSFSQKSGLTTTRIFSYTRNPNYLGMFVFIGGLCVMGWSDSLASIAFLLYFIYTLFYLHWVV